MSPSQGPYHQHKTKTEQQKYPNSTQRETPKWNEQAGQEESGNPVASELRQIVLNDGTRGHEQFPKHLIRACFTQVRLEILIHEPFETSSAKEAGFLIKSVTGRSKGLPAELIIPRHPRGHDNEERNQCGHGDNETPLPHVDNSVVRDTLGPPRLTRDGREAYFSRRITEADVWIATLR